MSTGGMEADFKRAFSEYGDAIFRFSLVRVGDIALAEDLTQETFTRFWQALRDGKEMTNTRSYLYTIANNLAKDWYKKRKSESLDARMEIGQEPASRDISPEMHAAYAEALASFEDLEEGDREVLLLKYIEGLPPKEIADMLGESANTISVRINRAEKRLRAKLHTETS